MDGDYFQIETGEYNCFIIPALVSVKLSGLDAAYKRETIAIIKFESQMDGYDEDAIELEGS